MRIFLISIFITTSTIFSQNCFEKGIDYVGNDVKEGYNISTSSAEDCQWRCQENDQCQFWTWDRTWKNACWLKTAMTETKFNYEVLSGPKYCVSKRSSKKGVSFDPKRTKCDDFRQFDGMGWYYNWGTSDPRRSSKCKGHYIPSGFVPMIWTKKQHYPKLDGYDTVLGFNEPNHKDQANMSPESAAYHWMRFQAAYPGKKLVSPAAAPPGVTQWFDRFFKACKKRGCRVDYLATHLYSGNAAYDKKFLENLYHRYGKKIWLTEFAKPSTMSSQAELNYMKEILPYLEGSNHIWRYSWFVNRFTHHGSGHGWYLDRAISLLEADKSRLTKLGKYYNGFKLSDSDSYSYNPSSMNISSTAIQCCGPKSFLDERCPNRSSWRAWLFCLWSSRF